MLKYFIKIGKVSRRSLISLAVGNEVKLLRKDTSNKAKKTSFDMK